MRFFYFYEDDCLHPALSHTNGELVNRRPLIVSFEQKSWTGRKNGRQASATRLGKAFAEKLWRTA